MKLSKQKILLIRARKCLSVPDMKKAGLNAGDLNAINAGRAVRPETAGKIAAALGVDVTEILEDVI